jgi:hypothetical protein
VTRPGPPNPAEPIEPIEPDGPIGPRPVETDRTATGSHQIAPWRQGQALGEFASGEPGPPSPTGPPTVSPPRQPAAPAPPPLGPGQDLGVSTAGSAAPARPASAPAGQRTPGPQAAGSPVHMDASRRDRGTAGAAASAGAAGSATSGPAAPPRAAAGGPSGPVTPFIATVDGPGPRPNHGRLRSARGPALSRLLVGRHRAPEVALNHLQVSSPGTGLVLGYDQAHQPVLVRLFRPEPTRVALVGGLWISRLIAFRALALGAWVIVFTGRPEAWRGFGAWATHQDSRVTVVPSDQAVAVTGSSLRPALLLYDGDLLGAAIRPALGPWQSQLTVLRRLTAYGVPAMQESSLFLTQRLDGDETGAAAPVLRLPTQTAALVQGMTHDMLAMFSGGTNSYVWVTPTSVEHHQFGAPHR